MYKGIGHRGIGDAWVRSQNYMTIVFICLCYCDCKKIVRYMPHTLWPRNDWKVQGANVAFNSFLPMHCHCAYNMFNFPKVGREFAPACPPSASGPMRTHMLIFISVTSRQFWSQACGILVSIKFMVVVVVQHVVVHGGRVWDISGSMQNLKGGWREYKPVIGMVASLAGWSQ